MDTLEKYVQVQKKENDIVRNEIVTKLDELLQVHDWKFYFLINLNQIIYSLLFHPPYHPQNVAAT